MTKQSMPKKIGRYRIQAELGQGAMGVVYKAEDRALARSVALKTIHENLSRDEAYQKRFFAEARAAAALSHPGIIVVYDIGLDAKSGRLFMALEFLRGRPLDTVLASGGRLEWPRAVALTQQLAEALHHAHSHGIVHRDVKPSNVMVLPSGEPKIMDFGIAKLPASQLTQAGQVFGSPAYMSPERVAQQPVDRRADVFSLGAVLYELLTGQRAFSGPNIPTIIRRLVNENPVPPSRVVTGCPPALDAVVARSLAKSPDARYDTADALALDLRAVLKNRTVESVTQSPGAEAPDPGAKGRGTVLAGEAAALPPGKSVSLGVLSGPSKGRVERVDRPCVLIGRAGADGGAQIEIPDLEMSGAHAVLECYGDRIVLRDVGSTNGTYVDDERIELHDLKNGEEFRSGRTRFKLMVAPSDTR